MRILFVCLGNAGRSPVAESFLKKFKPDVEVDSAGTHPYYKILDVARTYLKRQKADRYLKNCPESLEGKKLNDYDLIVAMEPAHKKIIVNTCPECYDKVLVWNIDDPYNLPTDHAEEIFNEIRLKTKELADSI